MRAARNSLRIAAWATFVVVGVGLLTTAQLVYSIWTYKERP